MTLTDWTEITHSMQKFHAVALGCVPRVEEGQGAPIPKELGAGNALAQLFDPARRESITVTLVFARHWCAENSGWTWEAL